MLSTAMKELGELNLAQADGRFPTTVASGKAPGEGGVSILRVHFQGGVRLRAQPRRHLVSFHLTDLRIDCRIGGQTLRHDGPPGSFAICPAGIDCKADADQSVEALFVAIDPGQLALAAAENEALDARLIDRLSGYDRTLFDFARTLALESGDGYPNGPLFWNDAASAFIDRLVARHTSKPERKTRGALSDAVLKRVKDYVLAHLDESLDVATLASLAGRSPFHFSRVFTRSVGISPYRYIVRLRLQRAIELVRARGAGLAEIAARTGFADQSHLSRWVRRVHGVPLTRFRA